MKEPCKWANAENPLGEAQVLFIASPAIVASKLNAHAVAYEIGRPAAYLALTSLAAIADKADRSTDLLDLREALVTAVAVLRSCGI